MANIMITERCNLRCSYCFANEFVNKEKIDITLEDFNKAVDFILTDPSERIGIIGGEPCTHPKFKDLMEILIQNQRVKRVVVFTNGVYVDKFLKLFTNEKMSLLVNCNPPSDTGTVAFQKLQDNLDLLINEYYMKSRITLGINMYRPGFEYEYMLELLKRYKFDNVRTSIVVPNTEGTRDLDPLEYFREIKPSVKNFFTELFQIRVLPRYDCNLMPSCILSEEEAEQIRGVLKSAKNEDSNLLGEIATCRPVIDILPNLQAVRCFGLSQYGKVAINDFSTIAELRYYFMNRFDAFAYNTIASKECATCQKRMVVKCTGGCIAFKADQVEKLYSHSQLMMGNIERRKDGLRTSTSD